MATSTHKYYQRYGQAKVSYWPASQAPHTTLESSSLRQILENPGETTHDSGIHDSRPAFWVLVLLQRQLWIAVHSRPYDLIIP